VLEPGLDQAAELGEVTVGAVALLAAVAMAAQAHGHGRELPRGGQADASQVAVAGLARGGAVGADRTLSGGGGGRPGDGAPVAAV
jgi:hypothetical protein